MRPALRRLLVALCWCGATLPAAAAPIERGVAITDPALLRELDAGRLGLQNLLTGRAPDGPAPGNAGLFALPSMKPIRAALEADFARYIARHKAAMPDESIGVGPDFAFQLFDPGMLGSSSTRFVLAGIINRMDRAFVAPGGCGEIRLIYRLVRTDGAESEAARRLPMTLNLVLKARGEDAAPSEASATCSDIAGRWLATASPAASAVPPQQSPLDLISSSNIDRIETNLQIAYAPKSGSRDFRTDYLLKVFNYNRQSRRFAESVMENQIDRDRLLSDRQLAADFRNWLLDPAHLREFDRGIVVIPDRFLATSALAPTPAAFARPELQAEFGLMEGEGDAPVFTRRDVVGALQRAAEQGIAMENIRSVAGFQRRLTDVTCAGCHQTRGIGAFHFPGVDWSAGSSSTIVAASPHFFADQPRRRDILTAFRDGRQPDFSRGFADRPQSRRGFELSGTVYQDGWGAHCYARTASDNDASFRSWTCAEGLSCQVVSASARLGMCFIETR